MMTEPTKLVLLRHGESVWNLENIFTGWTDIALSSRGESEARDAGRVMSEQRLALDVVHTSVLVRAIATANLCLEEMGMSWLPVSRHWRLNERHYGALQGLNKKETADKYGLDQVHIWRRSYATPPPALALSDERHPVHDRRYGSLAREQLPATECLADVVDRMLPYWYDAIIPDLAVGRTTLVVAHGNSLRALVMHLDGISESAIPELNIPTGMPRLYEFDNDLSVVSARYLGDPDAVAAAAAAVAKQAG
ncbi:MAG: 2,3-diphosphoglycerate-dependent phosphoglycerate mutase [Acidimicrobiia bacterium]|nr:MAG: 2,3-diphosphoglycerate-dependent phosphoglycerate mutase [Acidimicrobiia bacterium]